MASRKAYRKRISRKRNQRVFRSGAKTHKRNLPKMIRRGGIRA